MSAACPAATAKTKRAQPSFEAGETGFEISPGGKRATVGTDGIPHGVGMAAFEAGGFEIASGGKRIEGGGTHAARIGRHESRRKMLSWFRPYETRGSLWLSVSEGTGRGVCPPMGLVRS